MKRRTFFGTVAAGLASLVGIKGAGTVSEKTRVPDDVVIVYTSEETVDPIVDPMAWWDADAKQYVIRDWTPPLPDGYAITSQRLSLDPTCQRLDVHLVIEKKNWANAKT